MLCVPGPILLTTPLMPRSKPTKSAEQGDDDQDAQRLPDTKAEQDDFNNMKSCRFRAE